MVAAIAIHNKTISITAKNGFWSPKKSTDHTMFKNNCTPNAKTAVLFSFFVIPRSQMRKSEIPIRINKVVQTGAKIQFGGLNAGLLIPAYHVLMEGAVKREPNSPAAWQIKMETMNFAILVLLIPIL